MPPSGCDEDDLVASLSESGRFSSIFERHLSEIHRYLAYRVGSDLADDLAAETFLRAFRGRRNFVSSDGSVTAWLYGIATNLVRHHHRDEQRRLRLTHKALHDPSPSTGEEFVDRLAQRAVLDDAFARLDRKARDVVILVAGAGLTYEEAAAALGIPVGTVRSRFSRARNQMRTRLGAEPDDLTKGVIHRDNGPA
jgi:RNA polymerase sigma-70 factor (ECF subfamily)